MRNSRSHKGRVVLTLHDVCPHYEEEIAEFVRDLKDLSIKKLNLAVVPCFNGRYDLRQHPKFCRELESLSAFFEVELLLHGLFHTRTGENQKLSPKYRILSRLWSDGEDEFFQLSGSETEARIDQGMHIFQEVFLLQPKGFIPPAWIFSKEHLSTLSRHGISHTESHFSIIQTQTGSRSFNPAIAFSTRTGGREFLSRYYAAVIKNTLANRSLLRVAIHPSDYHSTQGRDKIIDLLVDLSRTHTTVLYRDIM